MSSPRAAALALSLVCLVACGDDSSDSQPDSGGTTVDGGLDPDAQAGPVVAIDDGQLRGAIDGETRRFLGIPFAAPPVGPLRWKAPTPNQAWYGIRDATEFGGACAQPSSIQAEESLNEDCLYLNVWSPDPAPTSPLPVMVWFHGGGNEVGSTADEVPLGVGGLFYNGRLLAESYGVIVVTTNYRLGALGFFYHPDLAGEESPEGNQGLLDQRAALEWVRDNIEAFGGDPDNVTIFGESAGSFDVCFHIASPGSRGLFHRAIGQSGGCTTRVATRDDLQASAAAFTEAMGCAAAKDALACLRDKAPADLLVDPPIDGAPAEPLPGGSGYQGGTPRWRFSPVVDSVILPDQPRALFDSGDVAMVPYILGSNTDEGTLFHIGADPVLTQDEYLEALGRRFGEEAAQDIVDLYPIENFDTADDALQRVTGDASLVCSTHDTARRAAAAGLPVWMYNFDVPIPIPGLEFLGATHGAEIAFVFGSVEDAAQADVGDAMRTYWTSLAATGDPNGKGKPTWPVFGKVDARMNINPDLEAVTDFRADECEFWRTVYDAAFIE
jgi:para-nitrobenzyl esterase